MQLQEATSSGADAPSACLSGACGENSSYQTPLPFSSISSLFNGSAFSASSFPGALVSSPLPDKPAAFRPDCTTTMHQQQHFPSQAPHPSPLQPQPQQAPFQMLPQQTYPPPLGPAATDVCAAPAAPPQASPPPPVAAAAPSRAGQRRAGERGRPAAPRNPRPQENIYKRTYSNVSRSCRRKGLDAGSGGDGASETDAADACSISGDAGPLGSSGPSSHSASLDPSAAGSRVAGGWRGSTPGAGGHAAAGQRNTDFPGGSAAPGSAPAEVAGAPAAGPGSEGGGAPGQQGPLAPGDEGAHGTGPSWKPRPTRRREGLRLRALDAQEEWVLPPDGKLYAYLLQRDKLAYNLWRKEVQRASEETGGAAGGEIPPPGGSAGVLAASAMGGRQRKRKENTLTLEPPRRLLRTLRPEDEFSWEESSPESGLGDLASAAETPGAGDAGEATGAKLESDVVDGAGEGDAEGRSGKEEKDQGSQAGDASEANEPGGREGGGAKEEDEDGGRDDDGAKYHLEPYDACLEEEEERRLPLQMPNGVQRRKDDMTVPVEENPHWVIVCRFLSFFGATIGMEDWTFAAVREMVEARELTEFGARFFSRISALFGRRYTPGNNLVRFLCKMLDERDGTDFNALFPLDINPFTVRTWEEVRPYQRLRVMRLFVNRAAGESTAIQHFVEGLRNEKLEELRDGSFYVDAEGYVFWFVREPQLTGFRFYKEDQREGTYELLASTEQQLQEVIEGLRSQLTLDTELIGLLLQQAQEIRVAAATQLLREQQERQQQQRQQALQLRMQAATAAGLDTSGAGLAVSTAPGAPGAGSSDASPPFHDAFNAAAEGLGGEPTTIEYRIMMKNRLRGPRERGTRLQARTQRIEMQQLEACSSSSMESFPALDASASSPAPPSNSLFLSPFSSSLYPASSSSSSASGSSHSTPHPSFSSSPAPAAFAASPSPPFFQAAGTGGGAPLAASPAGFPFLPAPAPSPFAVSSSSSAHPPYSLSASLASAASAAASSGGGTPAAAAAAAAALAAGAAAAGGSGGGTAAPILPHCPLLISTSSLQHALSPYLVLSSHEKNSEGTGASSSGDKKAKSGAKKGAAYALPPLWGVKGGQHLGASQLMAGNAVYAALHLALMTYPVAVAAQKPPAGDEETEGDAAQAAGAASGSEEATAPDVERAGAGGEEEREKREAERPAAAERQRGGGNLQNGESIRFAVQDHLLKNISDDVELLEDLREAAEKEESEEARKECADEAAARGKDGKEQVKVKDEEKSADAEKKDQSGAAGDKSATSVDGEGDPKKDEEKRKLEADGAKKAASACTQALAPKGLKKKKGGFPAGGPLPALGQSVLTAADVLAFFHTLCWAGRRAAEQPGEGEEKPKAEVKAATPAEATAALAAKEAGDSGAAPSGGEDMSKAEKEEVSPASAVAPEKKEVTEKSSAKQIAAQIAAAREYVPPGLVTTASTAASLLEKNEIRLATASSPGKSEASAASSLAPLPSSMMQSAPGAAPPFSAQQTAAQRGAGAVGSHAHLQSFSGGAAVAFSGGVAPPASPAFPGMQQAQQGRVNLFMPSVSLSQPAASPAGLPNVPLMAQQHRPPHAHMLGQNQHPGSMPAQGALQQPGFFAGNAATASLPPTAPHATMSGGLPGVASPSAQGAGPWAGAARDRRRAPPSGAMRRIEGGTETAAAWASTRSKPFTSSSSFCGNSSNCSTSSSSACR
ncbi:hypothetical protein BESB_065220 [Besnoitia besnoiti]|uniref:Uncharacterized protein n=1 Tax=Besnoitia besnoiti TaxID=94643 RepID=A0A2A9MGF8_BESBE|nr:hypothetical protein BESB_065220 [Besnoitia besnoiti]PFH34490.1 hypothetical protein BESB_065220 [Besnoitia besnoiti]